MFRTKRLLWAPFVLLVGSFVAALGIPYDGLDANVAGILVLYVQMAFLPQGLIIYLIAGFLAPRGSYLVGLLLGVVNALLLGVYTIVRSEEVLAGGDPSQAQAGLLLLVGYAVVVGPIAAAFAAWYRSFLNRMGEQGRERRRAKEAEQAKKAREERRAAKRPASKTSA
jgi:hypothetical protein